MPSFFFGWFLKIVSVGRLFPGVRNVHPWVTGESHSGAIQLHTTEMDSSDAAISDAQMDDSPVVRLWAYLTIKVNIS